MALPLIPLAGAAIQGASSLAGLAGKAFDPNRAVRRAARNLTLGAARTAMHSPQNLGLSEQRIKQDVGKITQNTQTQVGAATREAMRDLRTQPGYRRGAESKLLAAAQDATAAGAAGAEAQIRSVDAQLETQQAADIMDRTARMGYEQAPFQRSKDLPGVQAVTDVAMKGGDTMFASTKAIMEQYDADKAAANVLGMSMRQYKKNL